MSVYCSGDNGTTEEASGAGPQKALPPWMLRQGITSTSNASGGTQMGAVLLQAAAAATGSSAGLSTSSEVVASEEDQKRIEVGSCSFHAYDVHSTKPAASSTVDPRVALFSLQPVLS